MRPGIVTRSRDGSSAGHTLQPSWRGDKAKRALGWLGIVLHSTYVALHYYLTLLLAPPWAAYLLWGAWALLLLLAVHLLRRRSAWALAVPFAAYALWVGALTLGERLLGWTA